MSYRSEEVLLATLDYRSKYGESSFAISDPPGLWLSATESTLHLKRGHACDSDSKARAARLGNLPGRLVGALFS